MIIDSKVLENFFRKANCDDTINECVVNFDKDKISMISRDPANIVLVNVEMKAPIKNYTPLGKLGFRNLKTFVKYLGRFNGDIDVNVDGNLLVLKQGDRVIEYILADENAIQTEEISFPNTANWGLSSDVMSAKILKDSAENFITLKTYSMSLKVVNGKLLITTGDNESDRITESCSTNLKNCATKIGESAIKLIKELPDGVKLSVGTDVPVVLESEDDGVIFKCVIAPRVENKN